MKLLKLFALILLSGLIFSCDDDNASSNSEEIDFLIFGHFYGECWGETCVETYKIEDNTLFEDSVDDYGLRSFDFYELDNEKFELVKDLSDFIPSELYDETETTIGCPDCGDWGGLYLSISENEEIKSWRLDLMKDNVPAYLHELIDKIQEKIALIND